MNISESIIQAFNSVKENKLRASLTLLSISIGVFAIMGAGALISSINAAVSDQLSALGENTFYIRKMPGIQMGMNSWRKYRKRKSINYSQFKELKRMMVSTDMISAFSATNGYTIKNGDNTSDPDVSLIGTDENYFSITNYTISKGRVFTQEDVSFGRNVAIIGNDIAVKVFPNIDPVGKDITIKNQKFVVIGVLEAKGAMMGHSQDNMVMLPVTEFLKYYASWWEESLIIMVNPTSSKTLNATMDEAIGNMRVIRNLKPWEENSFEVETNESISEQFGNLTKYLGWFGYFSGFIALIAAGVGIMNIMLVSIKERTREIGVRKAVGAKRRWVLFQFLIETITLCQIGGIIGIILGYAVVSGLGVLMSLSIVFPVNTLIASLVICTILGIAFGAYPAWRASKLDPIEALRYE